MSIPTALSVYTSKRILPLYLLGFASGLPLPLIISTLSLRLKDSGVDISTIGLFSAVGIPYTIKFLWAPMVDHLKLPGLTDSLGLRRGWILASQVALIIMIFLLGWFSPSHSAWVTALLALGVAFFSATQDIVIDAFRIESIKDENEQGYAAAALVLGYRIALLVSGGVALILSDHVSWAVTYGIMAACMMVGVVTTLFVKEPTSHTEASKSYTSSDWIRRVVVMPFADFLKREKLWYLILLVIIFYKFGDAFAGVMTNVFAYDIGFTKSEIGTIIKIYGTVASLFGTFLGGYLIHKYHIWAGLWIGGILQMLSNLMFVWQANVGANEALLIATISMENAAGGIGTAAFVAFISQFCKVPFTATQYALLSSLAAVGRTFITSSIFLGDMIASDSPFIETIGWAQFFLITTACAVPGLILLGILQRYRKVA